MTRYQEMTAVPHALSHGWLAHSVCQAAAEIRLWSAAETCGRIWSNRTNHKVTTTLTWAHASATRLFTHSSKLTNYVPHFCLIWWLESNMIPSLWSLEGGVNRLEASPHSFWCPLSNESRSGCCDFTAGGATVLFSVWHGLALLCPRVHLGGVLGS